MRIDWFVFIQLDYEIYTFIYRAARHMNVQMYLGLLNFLRHLREPNEDNSVQSSRTRTFEYKPIRILACLFSLQLVLYAAIDKI